MLNRILLVWIVFCGAFMLLYGLGARQPQAPAPVAPVITPLAPLPQAAALAEADNMLQRPLFWPSRRAKTDPQTPTSAATLDGIELLGLAGSGKQALAILRKDSEIIRLWVGQYIDGWRFGGARYNGAAFVRDGETRVIKMPRIDMNDILSP